MFFFFKQKTAYEIYQCDWSSDVCSSDLVRAACELLGLDPLVLANEGKLVAFVARRDADKVLGAMREHAYGAGAVIIGEVQESEKPRVYLRTLLGSRRILSMPTGEQLPRIC